jgi:hypothetical protein
MKHVYVQQTVFMLQLYEQPDKMIEYHRIVSIFRSCIQQVSMYI